MYPVLLYVPVTLVPLRVVSQCCTGNLRVVCPPVTWLWVRGGLGVCLCPEVWTACLQVLSVYCLAGWLAVWSENKACSGACVGGGSFHCLGLSMCGNLWVWQCRSEF